MCLGASGSPKSGPRSGMAQTLRGLCGTALGFGTAAMAAQAVLAGPCARYLLHDIRAETALLILAPSLPFMAVSGAMRGCFLAARRVQPNITAQLVEQLVRMAVAAAGLRLLAQWGAGYGCAAVMLGNTVSEGISCGIMLVFAARTPEFAPRPGARCTPIPRGSCIVSSGRSRQPPAGQRLQAAELLQCFLYRGIHLGGIAHIGVQSHKAPAGVQRLCLLHNIQGSIFAAVPGKGNIVPGAGKLQNGGGTNAAASRR